MLYPKQQQVAQALVKGYSNQALNEGNLYLSGEMGSGKTYIASSVANQIHAKHTLIICPPAVVNKWKTVYQEYNHKSCDIATPTHPGDPNNLPGALIISQMHAYRIISDYIKQMNPKDTDILDLFKHDLHNWMQLNSIAYLLNSITKKYNFPKFDFVIFDEVHTYQSTRQIFQLFALLTRSPIKTLSLTGTIFNQNISYLADLLHVSNAKLLKPYKLNFGKDDYYSYDTLTDYLHNYAWFNYYIWRYIAVQISLNDVQKEIKTKKHDIKQEIMPLQGLDLTPEQEAWQQLVLTANDENKKLNQLITTYLDYPTMQQPMSVSHHKLSIDSDYQKTDKSFIGMQLTPIKFENTAKFKQLNQILQTKMNTIIFVQDSQLLKALPKVLDNCASIPQNTVKTKIAKKVNDLLKTDINTIIATTKQISTGVDLNMANRIIWYQVPPDVATILQAQRRVLRLNSTKSSQVYYLFYKNTNQETIINEVSQSAIRNAAAYNIRDTDNLAKLTHILFDNIKN